MTARSPLAVDAADHGGGIGTHAAGVLPHLASAFDLVELRPGGDATGPLVPLALAATTTSLKGIPFYSPGYLPPLWWRGPTVVTVHDLQYLDAAADPLRRRYMQTLMHRLRRADRILTVSEESAEELSAHLDPARITVVGNGVSDAFFAAFDRPRARPDDAPPRVVYVGSIMSYKRVDRLIEVIAEVTRLRDETVELSLPAEAVACYGELLTRAPKIQVVDRPAGLSEETLAAEVADADLLVTLSVAEGFGLPPLEALAAGTRVCAVDLPGARRRYGTTATLIDPDAGIVETAHIVADILDEDAATLAQRRLDGARHASSYRWSDVAERVRGVIEEVG